jgi:hypothetical protein
LFNFLLKGLNMKMFAIASLLATIIICPPADARSIQRQDHYILHNVEINGVNEGYVAEVIVDNALRTIRLDIMKDRCGYYSVDRDPNMATCMAMPARIASLQVPVQNHGNDGCGSYVTSGVKALNTSNWTRTEIEIKNHTHRMCDDIVPSTIVVRATVESLRSNPVEYIITK